MNNNPLSIFPKIIKHRELLGQFIRREVFTKYKGSFLGVFWSFLTPLVMLAIYTFVFSVIFQAKWELSVTNSTQEFAVILFCGMIVYSIFSETLTKSASIIVNNPNYVKKVVFPLEILPISLLGSAMVNFFFSFIILLVAKIFIIGGLSLANLWLPIVLAPLLFYSLGFSYILSSLGVYMRDVEHTVLIVVQALYFLTPIVFPKSAVPASIQSIMDINPMAVIIENVRMSLLWGNQPDLYLISIHLICSVVFMCLGYWWFMKLRKGFSDVI